MPRGTEAGRYLRSTHRRDVLEAATRHQDPELRAAVDEAAHLPFDLWQDAYRQALRPSHDTDKLEEDIGRRSRLAWRVMSNEQIQFVVDHERHPSVLRDAFSDGFNTPPNDGILTLIRSGAPDQRLLESWISMWLEGYGGISAQALELLRSRLSAAQVACWLLWPEAVTDEQIEAALPDLNIETNRLATTLLGWLFATRATVLRAALRSGQFHVEQAAAQCRHLRAEDLTGIDLSSDGLLARHLQVSSSVVVADRQADIPLVTGAWQDVTDICLLEDLTRFVVRDQRYWDIPALSANPHLTAANRSALHRATDTFRANHLLLADTLEQLRADVPAASAPPESEDGVDPDEDIPFDEVATWDAYGGISKSPYDAARFIDAHLGDGLGATFLSVLIEGHFTGTLGELVAAVNDASR